MTDRPIIYSAPMVRGLLAGRKTQTRRLATSPLRRCEASDRLWVREAWRTGLAYEDLAPSEMGGEEQILFECDGAGERWTYGSSEPGRLRPSMHMPRWASRLTLIVEAVRTETLQAISGSDAEAEGVFRHVAEHSCDKIFRGERADTAIRYYRDLWTSLHGADSWAANPEVVAITFRVVRGNIDRGEG